MLYDLKSIMKRAWAIKKLNKKNIFGLCLKISWMEFKKQLRDKYAHAMLKKFCESVRPRGYRWNLTVPGMVNVLAKNNIEIPSKIMNILMFY